MFVLIPLCPCIMVFPLFRQMLSVHFCGGEGVGGVHQLLEPPPATLLEPPPALQCTMGKYRVREGGVRNHKNIFSLVEPVSPSPL